MIQTGDYQRINELLERLGEHLDSDYRPSAIQRAYIAAQNSMCGPNRSERFAELAARLREAAAIAEQLAGESPQT